MRLPLFLIVCVPLLFSVGCKSSNPNAPITPVSRIKIKPMDAKEAPIVVGKASRIYHSRHCQYAANLQQPTGFRCVEDVDRLGLIPCEFCGPQLAEVKAEPEVINALPKVKENDKDKKVAAKKEQAAGHVYLPGSLTGGETEKNEKKKKK